MTNRIVYLLRQHVSQALDAQEQAELQAWAASHPAYKQLLEEVTNEETLLEALSAFDAVYGGDKAASIARMEHRIKDSIVVADQTSNIRRFRQWLPYAAAVVLAAIVGSWVFFGDQLNLKSISNLTSADIAPGTNRATLTLADGRNIDLRSEQSGIVVGAEDITYVDGSLVMEGGRKTGDGRRGEDNTSESQLRTPDFGLLTLTTPKGGTYQLTLSDGTQVWLNAGSTLKYPSRFSGDERVVELEGEAYFDVASSPFAIRHSQHPTDSKQQTANSKQQEWPFWVVSKGQRVEVLGTQFNISAYPDESETKTTLVEGKVQVVLSPAGGGRGRSVVLQPGTQSSLSGADINIHKVDVSSYIAWKDGFFHFDGTVPQDAFSQLSRWYDLEVVYEGKLPSVRFYGMMGRDKGLASVLGILKESGLGFRIEKTGDKNKLFVVNE